MTRALSIHSLSKQVGATTLFTQLRFTVPQGATVGIIGANGSGKSTLLRILSGEEEADAGEVEKDPNLPLCTIRQAADFGTAHTVEDALAGGDPLVFAEASYQRTLSQLQDYFALPPFETPLQHLSGGQRKRVQLAAGICREPEILLLDEPTNHLDIQSREALEAWIAASRQTWLIVTHDRWLLHTLCDHLLELNAQYPGGGLFTQGNYQDYLKRRTELLQELQQKEQRAKSQAKRELAWLRQGAKARSTKSKQRTDTAWELIHSLKSMQSVQKKDIDFSFTTSGKKSKDLIVFEDLCFSYDTHVLVESFSWTAQRGNSVGILGENGSGKSTLLKLCAQELTPSSGKIKITMDAAIGVFSQIDPHAESKTTLRSFFAPESDAVVFRGESIHVASWAMRFGFSHEQLQQPLHALSGGERSRARLAQLLLEPADILLLDEPTNDLDIETLEFLEESLLSFPGVLLVVSHDRYFLNRVCNRFIGTTTGGRWQEYAEIPQWLTDNAPPQQNTSVKSAATSQSTKKTKRKNSSNKKLSYLEQREYEGIEAEIQAAEARSEKLNAEVAALSLEDPAMAELQQSLAEAQQKVEQLYARWELLEEKLNS